MNPEKNKQTHPRKATKATHPRKKHKMILQKKYVS